MLVYRQHPPPESQSQQGLTDDVGVGAEVGLKRERPVLTSDMGIEQKKALLEEYMLKCGYSKSSAEDIIHWIYQSEVTDYFAPSFYAALEKGYIEKYISTYSFGKYFTDETIMSKMNKVIDLMVSKDYSEDDIYNTIRYISWSDVTKDLPPSFYAALEKGSIGKYTRQYEYFTNETIMSKMNKVIDLMISKGYSKKDIKNTVSYISWSEVKEAFAPSFYAALEKGYLEKYIYTDSAKYYTDETAMAKMNGLIELMISKGYSEGAIYTIIRYSPWSKVTDDLAPSFYTLLDKGYIKTDIYLYSCAKYFTDETAMANLIRVMEPDGKEYMVVQTVEYIGDEICNKKLTKDEILSKIKRGERKAEREAKIKGKTYQFIAPVINGIYLGFIPINGPLMAAYEPTITKILTNLNPIAWLSWLVILQIRAEMPY